MVATKTPKIAGKSVVLVTRPLSKQAQVSGQIIPYQDSLDFSIKRDDDVTITKTGKITKPADPESTIKTSFAENFSQIAKDLDFAVIDGDVLEFWILDYMYKKGDKYFAKYMRGTISESQSSYDADDNAKRELTITITEGPVPGWTSIPADMEAELAFVFRGIGKIEGDAKNDGTDGGGEAYDRTDDGGSVVMPETN